MGHLQYVIPGFTADIEDVDMRSKQWTFRPIIYDHRTGYPNARSNRGKPGKPVNDGVGVKILSLLHYSSRSPYREVRCRHRASPRNNQQ
jgi:hypothetical protein